MNSPKRSPPPTRNGSARNSSPTFPTHNTRNKGNPCKSGVSRRGADSNRWKTQDGFRSEMAARERGGAEMSEVVRGLLGWSNKRTGLEFYRWDEKIIPRHGTEWGELLVSEPEIMGNEGCTVLVVILPRSWSGTEIQAVERAVKEAAE